MDKQDRMNRMAEIAKHVPQQLPVNKQQNEVEKRFREQQQAYRRHESDSKLG